MILNLSKIKTESLLLFCKDLILSYKNSEDTGIKGVDRELMLEFDLICDDILKQIQNVTQENQYYLENRKHYRIKAILDAYNFINTQISKSLKENQSFNPSMLYFSLLSLWFQELGKESRSKEYIYFILYPYTNVYDKLLVNIQDMEFKRLNIQMIELAEDIIYKLDEYSFVK